jgi:hypothetical protein
MDPTQSSAGTTELNESFVFIVEQTDINTLRAMYLAVLQEPQEAVIKLLEEQIQKLTAA